MMRRNGVVELLRVDLGNVELEGFLELPPVASGVVLFAHSGSGSRRDRRNQFVSRILHDAGLGTFLVDLLSEAEDRQYLRRFEIPILAARLSRVTEWLGKRVGETGLRIGYFGTSTGAAAALEASVLERGPVAAIVSSGGRPDLAADVLPEIDAPTLLIVGANDRAAASLNAAAYLRLHTTRDLVVIRQSSHLFEEAGALDEVGSLAADWFGQYLPAPATSGERGPQSD
jgi:putative phosphoribosyl transferase